MIKKKMKAFTLVEMAIVLFIISLLILIVIPNVNKQRQNAININSKAIVKQVEAQKNLYLSEHPEKQSVSVEELQQEGYVTDEQVKQYSQSKE